MRDEKVLDGTMIKDVGEGLQAGCFSPLLRIVRSCGCRVLVDFCSYELETDHVVSLLLSLWLDPRKRYRRRHAVLRRHPISSQHQSVSQPR